MAWYNNILSRFKNTPTPSPLPKEEEKIEASMPQIESSPIESPSIQSTTASTWGLASWVQAPTWSLILDMYNAYKQWKQERTKKLYEENQTKTKFETEWFSLDPYNVSQWIELKDSPIDHSVNTEPSEEMKWFNIIWKALAPKISKMVKGEDVELWTMWDAAQIALNYMSDEMWMWDTQLPSSSDIRELLNKPINDEELTFKTKVRYRDSEDETPVRITYNNPNRIEFQYDLWLYWMYEDAYKQWYIWEATWENTKDAFYEKYKDWFWIWNQLRRKNSAFTDTTLNKDVFFEFVDNEVARQSALAEKSEESALMKVFQDEKANSRIAQATQYARSIIWPAVENSLLKTVETRQEFMNDSEAIITDIFWRWNNVMHWAYRTKAHLQRLYNTTDLSTANLSPEHQVIYDDIVWGEKAFDQFIRNFTEWISLMPDYADPTTWKLERIPDAIVDPESWKMMTYHQFLFRWIDMDDTRWLPAVANDAQSPQDILDYNARFIRLKMENLEDWFLWDVWNRWQYWWAVGVWTPLNELSQQTLWRWLTFIQDIFSKESWEIPFAFTNMDTSIMSTLSTNGSNLWRLIQNFNVKTDEYVPELVWQIWFNYYLGKWLNNIWELTQIRTLWLMNKIPWSKSVGWQQFAQFVSYAPRALQLIWTDQTIDAIASIWDTESLSDFSKVLSIWWTFLWEWIWILRDLKVLNRSLLMNFSKKAKNYWWLTDPIRLIAENEWILDNYAAQIWRWTVDESWKIIWDQYKLLLQDLNEYSKWLKKMSDAVTQAVVTAQKNWVDLGRLNQDTKQAAYNVLKQVFKQDSAMARSVTNMLTDQRVNIADMAKYIWWIEWAVKIWPWVSTIKLTDNLGTVAERTVKNYDEWMDLIVEWWLVRWINEWLTKTELDELVAQWFINQAMAKDIEDNLWAYFTMGKRWDQVVYFPTEKWLKALWVESSAVSSPLAIVAMSEDTRKLIDKLKQLPPNKRARISDNLLEQMWETNAIDSLARNIADIDVLDICK